MAYEDKIKILKGHIKELKRIHETLYDIQDLVMDIERDISEIDHSLPSDKEIRAIKGGSQKREINKVLDLLDEAYELTDLILGPVDNPDTESPAGTLFTPEARGNVYSPEARGSSDISIDDILKSFPHKNTAS